MSSPSSSTTTSTALLRRTRDAEAELRLPAGFRFHPTDEELVLHYLRRRAASLPLPVPIIAEVDIYKYNPWDLPALALFGTKEWYFFTPRDRKYPNGSRPNRAAGSGYWKATGADKPVTPQGETRAMGIKKALVFYSGKAPRGVKTNWIMHEYRLNGVSRNPKSAVGSLRLDDWVLCRLYNKKSNWEEEAHHFLQMRNHTGGLLLPEPSSSVGVAADGCRTTESDVDNEVSFADQIDQPQYSPSMDAGFDQHRQQQPIFSGIVKEEQNTTTNYYDNSTTSSAANNNATAGNDWFLDLKLDDLHSPFTAFAHPGQDLFLSPTSSSFQDWFFSPRSFNSPVLPRTASQVSLLNF